MIAFAGLTHLGLVSGAAAAAHGFDVVMYDPDQGLCHDLAEGRLPVFEPRLAETVLENGARIDWTSDASDLASADIVFVAPDVPTGADGRADVTPVTAIATTAAQAMSAGSTLVIMSQVQPGFTRRLNAEVAIDVLYQVETLVFGRAVERALRPERFIIGGPSAGGPLPAAYDKYLSTYQCPVIVMNYESAELAKTAINLCLIASVSVANTLADVCEKIGASWASIVPALRLDPRIGPAAYIEAGLGLSGGNLERDLATVTRLASEVGTDASALHGFAATSARGQSWLLRAVWSALRDAGDPPRVALWGLAYKAGTASTKGSPALALAEASPGWRMTAFDPKVKLNQGDSHIEQFDDPIHTARGADVLVVTTPWPEVAEVDIVTAAKVMRGKVLIDPYRAVGGVRAHAAGLSYVTRGQRPEDP